MAILFVDDESKSRKYFSRVFGSESRRILTAGNGWEALETYRECPGEIAVVVTDQIMPRLTGLELLRELRETGAPVVCILSTAHTEAGLIEEAVDGGLIDYFVGKPWDLEDMEAVLLQAENHYRLRLSTGPHRGQVA